MSLAASAWVIIPAHNRREVTLRCLANLKGNGDFEKFHVLVVDDGSQDGTTPAIQAAYPEVEILRGDGTLWWTGAITLGMKQAMALNAEAVFWLNDDCHPNAGTLDQLVEKAHRINCVTAAEPRTGVGVVYSGLQKTVWGFKPISGNGSDFEGDACNGNCVCITRPIIEQVGYPDPEAFPQYHGDTDYLLRITQAGYPCIILASAPCASELPPSAQVESWLMSENPLAVHWKRFSTVKSPYHFRSYWLFCLRHWGLWGAVLFCLPYARLISMRLVHAILPSGVLLRCLGRHSLNWRLEQEKER